MRGSVLLYLKKSGVTEKYVKKWCKTSMTDSKGDCCHKNMGSDGGEGVAFYEKSPLSLSVCQGDVKVDKLRSGKSLHGPRCLPMTIDLPEGNLQRIALE